METLLDQSLLQIGCTAECLVQHERFYRTDDPPDNVIIQTNQIVGPKAPTFSNKKTFPFQIGAELTFTQKELYELQKIHIQKLIDAYQTQLDNLDLITQGNKASFSNADISVKRRHFYFCYLSSIMNLPVKSGFVKLNQIISLQKLFMNQLFKTRSISNIVERCCHEQGCPQVAIHGSKYCGWHILKESRQKLFEKCPECGWPRMINDFQPCKGHKGRQQKKGGHHNPATQNA